MDIHNSEKDLLSILELCFQSNKLESESQNLFHTWIANYSDFILSSNDFSLLRKYPLLCPAIVSHLIDYNTENIPLENLILTLLVSTLSCPIVTPIVSHHTSQYDILLSNKPPKSTIISLLDVITELVTKEPRVFRDLNLTSFLPLTSHKDLDIKLRAFKLFSILFQIDFESQSQKHLKKCLNIISPNTNEENTEYAQSEMNQTQLTFLKQLIATYPHWVEIQGVLLAKLSHKPSFLSLQTNLIMVHTTQTALQSIAFTIAQNTPVLIKGEIGVGKTMLVSHLANLMGHNSELVTVQLSDQTDSKSLIGNYTSTDIPGEFVWRPGALVHAMQTGKWLLLEDIDYAAKDVVSTLLPILENNLLPIPGMSEVVTSRVGFQIFATQRTNANGQPLFSSEASLLDKHWNVVQVSYPAVEELETIISQTFPNLSSTASKIIQIFRGISLETTESHFQIELLKRKITLRDLMKWCRRIQNFVNGLEAINLEGIFLEALDCFVVSFMSKNIQHSLANQLGNQLGLDQTKINYYFTNYKPSISFSVANFCIGRAIVPLKQSTNITGPPIKMAPFAYTQQTSMLLERLTLCVQYGEPVLLVGETGTGKTSTIQHLATQTNNTLVVINMSRQSDTIDLLGGYKPVDMDYLLLPLKSKFLDCFQTTFSRSKNETFIGHIERTFEEKKFDTLFSMMEHVCKAARVKGNISHEKVDSWKAFSKQLSIAIEKFNKMKSAFAFQFVEGALVRAIRNGWWVLLDEINLACPEVLECLNGILDQNTESILLADTHSNLPIRKNDNFHIFACMNPALDIGKKKLPQGIANRFTEIFVHELTQTQDLILLVSDYLQAMTVTAEVVGSIVEFYTQVIALASDKLVDGSGYRPHFSLRTLCRALKYSNTNPCRNLKHSIYEGLCLSFLTQLNQESYTLVEKLAQKVILKNSLSVLKQKIPKPRDEYIYTNILGYWIQKGNLEIQTPRNYVITPAIAKNLKDIARIASARQYPILLQGPTSSGKTSLIQWLATNTGNKVYRINNHEHTDLQEYIGSYIPDENGKLAFQEGLLPRAMRCGDWVILDELNLAPSDVLEALNRVLDDNRELFITETQTTIKAHPNFILFATQNPPGLYGGRKLLSKAFRNRFIELHFVEIPPVELVDILNQRCAIPKSYCKKMIEVMKELQLQRKLTGLFAGKYGYITLRDLFKWAERYRCTEAIPSQFRDWDQLLIEDGYLLLAGKLRHPEEIRIVAQVLEKHFHRIINEETLFNIDLPNPINDLIHHSTAILQGCVPGMSHIYPTKSFRRMLIHISRAVHFDEPILLVGPTGSGKTTACQLISKLHQKKLQYINCHMHTETADFIGSLRPIRNTDALQAGRLFEWMDGPLVQAVRNGEYMLLDEISLADDAVLERLNSLLEPERNLVIAEKGGDSVELTASHGFILFGTMNPGGDFGKKELSPALRNRFTEIWCPEIDTIEDTISMLVHNIKLEGILAQEVCSRIVTFVDWFQSQPNSNNFPISKRDLLCWVEFINISLTGDGEGDASVWVSFIEGAHLILLDGLGVGLSSELDMTSEKLANEYLQSLVANETSYSLGVSENDNQQIWKSPFQIPFGPKSHSFDTNYSMTTPTVSRNAYRILRALKLPKPILLEGIPGVGKSSIVMALARCYGYELVRINLSEQTDISDLFGADLPSDSGNAGEFMWRDGPLLRALKEGVWVLLDELNLASQSVLEGLNSCFDHRQEIYISELDRTFEIKTQSTRIFATQNPMRQGGGRKGLPKSFLNRFTKVFMQPLETIDLLFICRQAFSEIDEETLRLMVAFNQSIDASVNQDRAFGGLGFPFEFNLRDIFRWCQLMADKSHGSLCQPSLFVRIIYSDRMRSVFDKEKVFEIFKEIFHEFPEITKANSLVYDIISTRDLIQIGQATLERNSDHYTEGNLGNLTILPYQLPYMESVMLCVKNFWLPILVGAVGSGKSSIVRLLAKLTGNTLHEFSVNSAMDSYELVGGFHQVGWERKVKICLDRLQNELASFIKNNFHSNNPILQDMYSLYHVISRHILQNGNNPKESIESILEKTKTLKQIPSELCSVLNELQSTANPESLSAGQFVWIDSPLVSAAKQGHWLLIDNVNLCSASVLDRLNALLEPNGTLVLHEKGIVGENCEEIIPHENFRLFFCMDHKLGELSRAMRNRGIEICISDVSSCQDSISNTDMRYGLLDMKFGQERDSMNTLLGLYETSEIMQTDECIPSVHGNTWRSSSFITINPILSNVLSESEIFRRIPTKGYDENFQKNLSLLFIFLSTQSDITYREHFISQNTQIFTHATTVTRFICKHRLHKLVTSQIRDKYLQNLPLDISYRETFCRRSNLNRIMNEVEKTILRIHIYIIQLHFQNYQSSKASLYRQSKHVFQKKRTSENFEIKCISYLYPFVSNILDLLVEELFWSTHHRSNWDAINQSIIWLRNFIEYIQSADQQNKENLTIVWYLLSKNFLRFLNQKGVNWQQIPEIFSLITPIEEDLNTTMLDSPLVCVLQEFPRALPLSTAAAVDCAVGLQSLLDVIIHIPVVAREIICEISHLRSMLLSCSLDLSDAIEFRSIRGEISELNKKIRLPLDNESIYSPLRNASLVYFYDSILYLCSIYKSPESENSTIGSSINNLFEYSNSYKITNINILSLLSPTICLPDNKLGENIVYLQELFTNSITPSIQLLLSNNTPVDEILSYLSEVIQNIGSDLKSVTEQESNRFGIKLNNFEEQSGELLQIINHFACVSFTNFVSDSKNFENIFFITLIEVCQAFKIILPSKSQINLSYNSDKDEILAAVGEILLHLTEKLTNEQTNKEIYQSIRNIFKDCVLSFTNWIETNDLTHLYKSTVFLGLTMVNIFAPHTPLDPVVINQRELECLEKEFENLQSNLEAHKIYYNVCFGISVIGLSKQTPLPIEGLERKILNLENEMKYLKKRLAVRPNNNQYPEIFYTCRKVVQTLCDANKINELIEQLETQQIVSEKCFQTISNHMKSIGSTINSLQRKYLSYRDVITPITFSLSILLYGLYNITQTHKKSSFRSTLSFTNTLISFSKYNCLYQTNINRISNVINSEKFQKIPAKNREKICKLILIWILEIVGFKKYYFPLLDKIFYKILNIYVTEWEKFVEREKKKEIEKESLYKYKEEYHCLQTSDEIIEKDFKEKFPDYYENFTETECTETVSKPSKNGPNLDENIWNFTEETFTFLANVHSYFHSGNFLIETPKFNRQTGNSEHFLQQRILYQHDVAYCMQTDPNDELSNLHIAAAHNCLKSITEPLATEIYDFYLDPNPCELQRVKPVITVFKTKICNLLEEWPDHSVLNQLILVADRILSLSVTSPIMQILTGLQILITKAQDWEAYAAKHVSIQEELGLISQLVIRYRKMELEGWPRILEASERKYRMKSTKYFMHIYQVMNEYFGKEDIGNIEKIENLLKQFIESSCLGNLEFRLNLLKNFKFSFKFPNAVFHTLASLYSFYSQFIPEVKNRFESQCTPIEKELKEFVSISKWNDINYWRLKDSVEKSHKTIHKYVRKHQEVLNEPIRDLLIIRTFNLQKFPELLSVDWLREMKSKLIQSIRDCPALDISYILEECRLSNISLPNRTDKLSRKFLKYILRYSKDDKQLQGIAEFRNVTSEIRETMNEMISETKETLTPDQKEEMKKQKFLCVKKQRLLSELFKLLRTFGFSNRFTSTGGKTLLDTVDFSSIKSLLPSQISQTSVITSLQHIDAVFFENTKLIASLDISLRKPHKQLTPYLVESLRAYSIDILHSITTHRQQILQFAQSMNGLDCQIMHSSAHERTVQSLLSLPTRTHFYLDELCSVIHGLLEQLRECSCLVTGVSRQKNNYFPLDSSLLPQIMLDSNLMENIKQILDNTFNDVNTLLDDISSLQNCILFSLNDFTLLKDKYTTLSNSLQRLLSQLTNFLTCKATGHIELGFFLGLFQINSNFEKTFQQFIIFQHQIETVSSEAIANENSNKPLLTSNIFQTILTTVQELTKMNKSNITTLEELELSDSSRNTDCYLKNLLLNNEETKLCQLSKIILLLKKTISNLKSNLDQEEGYNRENTISFLQLQSILKSFAVLCESIFLKHVEIQINSNELLHTILSIFNLVSAKGFCTPEAVIEELAKEGDSVLQEFEGGGFGEGEGATNVSEQIDNQEQVEGLKGEESKDENRGEIKEEKGIEMSEDFEGGMGDKASGEDDERGSEGSREDDLDKRMGEVDEKEGQMDEELWGASSEDEEVLGGKEEGGAQSKEERLMAKDDSVKKRKSQNEDGKEDGDVDQLQDDLNDNLDLEDQKVGENVDNEQQVQQPETFDLPEDLNLDGMEREDSSESSLQGSDHDSVDEMDLDDTTQDPTQAVSDEDESNIKTMDKFDGNDSNNESELDTNQNDLPSYDTTQHAGDPQTAQQSSSKYGTGNHGDIDENTNNEDDLDKVGCLNDKDVTEVQDGNTGSENRTESTSKRDNNSLKSKLSRSAENRQLADEGEEPKLKKQRILNEDSQENRNRNESREQITDTYKHKTADSEKFQTDTTIQDSATHEQAKVQSQNSRKDFDLDSNDETSDDLESNRIQLDQDAELHMDTRVVSENKFTAQDNEKEIEDESIPSDKMEDCIPNKDLISFFASNKDYIQPALHTIQTDFPTAAIDSIQQLTIANETQKLWVETEHAVSHLSRELCEQLRLILQPQQASKLKGDYRTGKRLNMRKIIPYIASEFRNDKIWLRRTQPNKRQYQVMLAIDDSKSMANYKSQTIAFQTFSLLGNALTWLDVGQLGVCKFGETTQVILPLGTPFTQESAFQILQQLTMEQMKTKIAQMLRKITPLMVQNYSKVQTPFSGNINQLLVIISDGRGIFLEGRDRVEKSVRQTMENGIFVIFIILDSPDNRDSIVDIKVPIFSETSTLPEFKSYLEIFPFPFYIVLRDIQTLPETVSNALRQWFEFVASNEQ